MSQGDLLLPQPFHQRERPYKEDQLTRLRRGYDSSAGIGRGVAAIKERASAEIFCAQPGMIVGPEVARHVRNMYLHGLFVVDDG